MRARALLMMLAGSLLAVGCYTPYRQSVDKAEQALRNDDPVMAILHFRTACKQAGDAADSACERAEAEAARFKKHLLAQASTACNAGDVATCARILAPAKDVFPDDPDVRALRDAAGGAWARKCGATDSQDVVEAIARVKCLESASASVSTPRYSRHLSDSRARAASLLAARAEQATRPGARFLLADAAHSLHAEAVEPKLLSRARADLIASAAVPLHVKMRVTGAYDADVDACARLSPRLRAVVCGSGDPVLDIDARIDQDRTRYHSSRQTLSKRYVADHRRYPNPAHRYAQDGVLQAELALEEIETQVALQKAECEAAKRAYYDAPADSDDDEAAYRDRECEAYDALEDIESRRRSALYDARSRLNNTPAFIEEEIYATHSWTRITHTWDADYRWELTFSGEGIEPVTRSDTGTSVLSRNEQPGFAAAGIPTLSVGTPPTANELARKPEQRVIDALTTELTGFLDTMANSELQACAEETAWSETWLDCQARAQVWQLRDPGARSLLQKIRWET